MNHYRNSKHFCSLFGKKQSILYHLDFFIMKPIIRSVAASILLAFIFSGCEKENVELNMTARVTNIPECVTTRSASSTNILTPGVSCVDYIFDVNNNKLILKHLNAGFNCCAENISCDASLVNDTIIIEESEKGSPCKCNCLYDLDIEVTGVLEKKYQVKFNEPYAVFNNKIIFEMDLTKSNTGSYCVSRGNYPWIIL